MRVYHDFFLVPGSRSTFPDADPEPDPKHSQNHNIFFIVS